MNSINNANFKILIVDDNPKNIQVVGSLLTQEGYPTAFALNGRQAVEMARSNRFDLILLDVMMPETDGFEVCNQLKNLEETREIPVIFLTAKTDTDSIVQGFDVGGYDYVTKPFISRELLARVRSRLHIKSLNDELKKRYEEIRQLENMRETLTHMIVHDLKNPLNGIFGYASLLQTDETLSSDPKSSEYAGAIMNSAQTMLDMIMAILDVSRLETGEMQLTLEDTDIRAVLRDVVDGIKPMLRQSSLKLKVNLPPDIPPLRTDREILRRIIVNIIGNAIHFAPPESDITFSAAVEGKHIRLTISDQGPGIPEKYQEQIFDKFKQINTRGSREKYSTGLGLTFCKMAVEALGGKIGVESQPGKGSSFWFVLPGA
jgi:signal transduction histidine kinase